MSIGLYEFERGRETRNYRAALHAHGFNPEFLELATGHAPLQEALLDADAGYE
ncbi:MAG: hypothetical protein QM759_04980 [Terricaulis sp.]